LPWGSSVYAKVIAYNLYGYSASSVVGNGAVILTSPDAPINLQEIVASRSATSISIEWSFGAANGGSAVIDSRVTFDQANNDFVVLQAGISSTTYTATNLVTGSTY